MEFQLNKIDTNIRRKLQEKTSDNKIHRKQAVKIEIDAVNEEKDKKKNKKDSFSRTLEEKKSSYKNKNTVYVEAEKSMIEAQSSKLGEKVGFYIDQIK